MNGKSIVDSNQISLTTIISKQLLKEVRREAQKHRLYRTKLNPIIRSTSINVQPYNIPLRPVDFTPLTISTLAAARQRSIIYQYNTLNSNPIQNPHINYILPKRKPQINKVKIFEPKFRYEKEPPLSNIITPVQEKREIRYASRSLASMIKVATKTVDVQTCDKGYSSRMNVKSIIGIPFLYSIDQEKRILYDRLEKASEFISFRRDIIRDSMRSDK